MEGLPAVLDAVMARAIDCLSPVKVAGICLCVWAFIRAQLSAPLEGLTAAAVNKFDVMGRCTPAAHT
jgi:hypothetical protein